MIFNRLPHSLNRTALLLRTRYPTVPPLATRLAVRGAASEVSSRPGSQSLPHAALNIKEEVSHGTASLAETIAGGADTTQFASTAAPDSVDPTFMRITRAVAATVPRPNMIFGLAGALPYLGTTGASLYYASQAGQTAAKFTPQLDPSIAVELLNQALHVQVTYGAVMLSFLGALHWGMEFAGHGGIKGTKRLTLGIAPTFLGWYTLWMPDPTMALITQWFGFTGLWYADMKATMAGWAPPWYSQYRFYLSLLVGTCIVGTLAGNYKLGPVASQSTALKELDDLKKERIRKMAGTPVVPGEVGSVSGVAENADAYILIKHAKSPEEKREKEKGKEEQEQKEEKKVFGLF